MLPLRSLPLIVPLSSLLLLLSQPTRPAPPRASEAAATKLRTLRMVFLSQNAVGDAGTSPASAPAALSKDRAARENLRRDYLYWAERSGLREVRCHCGTHVAATRHQNL